MALSGITGLQLEGATMNGFKKLTAKGPYFIVPLFLLLLFFPGTLRAQYLIVDCTGANPSAYPSINAALPNATLGSLFWSRAVYGERLPEWPERDQSGCVLRTNGHDQRLDFHHQFAKPVPLRTECDQSLWERHFGEFEQRYFAERVLEQRNSGVGLNVDGMSDVVVGASGTFSHNASNGIHIVGNSIVALVAWAGPVTSATMSAQECGRLRAIREPGTDDDHQQYS